MASRPFMAQFQGDCEECALWWEPGDMIRYDDDDNLVHADCYEQPTLDKEFDEPNRRFTLKRDR